MLNSNDPIQVAHLQKLANQSMLNDALVIKIVKKVFSWKQEKLWSFDKASNVLIEKNRDMGSEKYISSRFC